MATNNWFEFWKNESESFFKVMRMSTFAFAERFKQRFNPQNAVILDFGCGPGFLAEALSETVSRIDGIDINEHFIGICKKRFPNNSFLLAPPTVEHQNILLNQFLSERKFDWIILLSISQYYPDKHELYRTIRMLTVYLREGGTILIADVITSKTSVLSDLFAVVKQSLLTGNPFSAIRFIGYLLFSDYRKTSSKKSLLKLETLDFTKWANDLNLNCVPHSFLTVHPTRMSYCLSSKTTGLNK